jgi:transcriptional regulator with XRE-family HTH domain
MEITIGANIKRLRKEKNITQEQLSAALNVSCAAVSKWEREESYPDITLLQPLAYYFGVTLDELMGYSQEKIRADIEEVLANYRRHWRSKRGREIITEAYRSYPNDHWVMHYYMWNLAGDLADNDPAVLIAHKEEFLSICEKLLEECAEENLRLGAWNMRAKILHAEGKTEEALEIYRAKFTDWYTTGEQKTEQLFAKDTDEYYFHVRKNMYELADFAADKLGRTVFFAPASTMAEKAEHALQYGRLLLDAFETTGEAFFLVLAKSFLGRMENDLCYRGGSDEQIIAVMEMHLRTEKMLEEQRADNLPLNHAFDRYSPEARADLFQYNLRYRCNAENGRRAELLQNPAYRAILDQYK